MSHDEWPSIALGMLVDKSGSTIQTGPFGSQLHQSDYTDDKLAGVPLVMPKDMVDGRVDYSGIARVAPAKASEMERHRCQRGDILLSRRGDIGRCVLIRRDDEDVLCGTGSLRVTLRGAQLDPSFLYYFLCTSHGRGELQSRAVGATMPNINSDIVRSVVVPVPPLIIQRKIAAILSAYDDLIENNNRRIKILEETAQRIYREWFVDFRYPGHETAPLRDSVLGPIPDGWNVGTLGDVVDVNSRTARSLEAFDSIEYIHISSVEAGRVQARRKLLPAEAPGRARRLLHDGDTIWSTVRPNLRAYALIVKPAPSWVASTGFAVLSPTLVPMSFLYALATDEPFVSYLVNHATGSAYPAVTGSVFEKAPIVRPPATLLARYEDIGDPVLRLAAELRTADSVLASARDLLLPRLISGEIDVENLNIEVPEVAA